MKTRKIGIVACLFTIGLLLGGLIEHPPIQQALSAVKYALDSDDTITAVVNPTFTGSIKIAAGSAPGTPSEGMFYMNDVENLLKYHNGTDWLTVGIDYSKQSLIDYDDYKDTSETTGEETAEEATWTNTNGSVWRDERTGLYWSDKYGSTKQNNFTVSSCDFFLKLIAGLILVQIQIAVLLEMMPLKKRLIIALLFH